MATIWEDLKKNRYPTIQTPRQLMLNLKEGRKSGKFVHKGYFIDFDVIREDSSAWVVSSERIGKGGYSSGGHYYVSKKNPNRAVWD